MKRYPDEVPEKFRKIIVLLDCGELGYLPLTGYMAEVKGELVFIAFGRAAYAAELVTRWDYLADVAPQYDFNGEMP